MTSYSAREFRRKVAAKDHFLSAVLRVRGPKEFLKGTERDLADLVGKGRSA